MAVFYGAIPIAAAFFNRHKWRRFRNRCDALRIFPILDYRQYRTLENDGGVFRFLGELESITDEILWVRGSDLTMPVSLKKTKCLILPTHEMDELGEPPEQIRWNRVSTITEGSKVYIGGRIKIENNRLSFCSTKKNPLIVIFYNCPDTELPAAIIRSSRTRNEYWNGVTAVSIVAGALALIFIAASFLNRPAFRLTVISALAAVFVPILPVFPPGLLFTTLYRRMTWNARKLRAYLDLARLPLRHLQSGKENSYLLNGEKYGYIKIDSPQTAGKDTPLLVPENANEEKINQWYFYGVLDDNSRLPQKPKDPFVSFGILPVDPALSGLRYVIRSYIIEAGAWFILLAGIFINMVFIYMILYLLGVVSG